MLSSCGGSAASGNADAKKIAEIMVQLEDKNSEFIMENIDAAIEILGEYTEAEPEKTAKFMRDVSTLVLEQKGVSKDEIKAELEGTSDEELVSAYQQLCVAIGLLKALK